MYRYASIILFYTKTQADVYVYVQYRLIDQG